MLTGRCQGFIQWEGGFIPGMNLTWGDIPHQLEVFFTFFSGFENLTTFKWGNFKGFFTFFIWF
jgi:hypothetical protein